MGGGPVVNQTTQTLAAIPTGDVAHRYAAGVRQPAATGKRIDTLSTNMRS